MRINSEDSIDPHLRQAIDNLMASVEDAVKEAAASSQEVERLRGEVARKDRIILEKVAAAPPKVDSESVAALVADLVQCGAVKASAASNLTESLMADPRNIVKLAAKLATISMPAPLQGRGIAKTASVAGTSAPSSDDEWNVVIQHGA